LINLFFRSSLAALRKPPGKSLNKTKLYEAIGKGDKTIFDTDLDALEVKGSIVKEQVGRSIVYRLATHLY
jgi:hypothetical protein